jgi:galactonate dehydratase
LTPAVFALALLAPNFVIQEMSLGIHYNTREHDLLTYLKNPEVFRVQEGIVEALEGRGLGVEIDEARVREAARTPHAWRNPVLRGPDGSVREW